MVIATDKGEVEVRVGTLIAAKRGAAFKFYKVEEIDANSGRMGCKLILGPTLKPTVLKYMNMYKSWFEHKIHRRSYMLLEDYVEKLQKSAETLHNYAVKHYLELDGE